MRLAEHIFKVLKDYIEDKNWEIEDWIVEIPKDKSIADYATNICFKLAKTLKSSPIKIADEIIDELNILFNDKFPDAFSIFALRGFVNLKLKPDFCYKYLNEENFSRDLVVDRRRYLLEYVSANPTGPLHIGHGRWAALGDSLQRIMKHVGYAIQTEFYINDAGNQINNLISSIEARKKNQPLPVDGYAGEYVKDLVDSEDPIRDIINNQRKVLEDFKVSFDCWFKEKKELHDTGCVESAINFMKEKDLTYQQNSALFFRSTDFGDDKDRVLIKADGDFTYFAADIAYHKNKEERGFSHLINIWGADHHGYIKRVKSALFSLFGDRVKFEVILGQLVSLYRNGEEVKMSKRTGEMITLEEVMEEIGTDAGRFFLVSKPADTPLDFDLELAKKQSSDNPVFYVQYAHARICSILRKIESFNVKIEKLSFNSEYDIKDIEEDILRFLVSFEDEVYFSALNRAPHKIATYLATLAGLFHKFYQECRILGDIDTNIEDKNVNIVLETRATARILIIKQVKKVLAVGLYLLGVSAPEKM